MALATYADLLSAVQDYQDDSSTVVTSRLADFVTLAEQRVALGAGKMGMPYYSPPLRVRQMEKRAIIKISTGQDGGTSGGSANAQTVTLDTAPTLELGLMITFTAGYSNTGAMTLNANSTGAVNVKKGKSLDDLASGDIIAGAEYTVYHDGSQYVLMPGDGAVPLPARYIGMRSVDLQGTNYGPLEFTPSMAVDALATKRASGIPVNYAIEQDCIRFDPLPNGTFYADLKYYARPSALSSTLNDIFRDAPSIYLYGTLLELALYLPDPEAAAKWHGLYTAACQGLVSTDQRDRSGAGPLRTRADVTI